MRKYWLAYLLIIFTTALFADPPSATEVFHVNVKPHDPNTFLIEWTIKPHFFIYQDRIKLQNQAEETFRQGNIHFPKTLIKKDSLGNKIKIYRDTLSLAIPILGVNPGEGILKLSFQGCADDGFCYPPQTLPIQLTINDKLALIKSQIESSAEAPIHEQLNISNQDKLKALFTSQHWLWTLIAFYGFGLLLASTPCILPMIPVLSSIIIGHGRVPTPIKAFLLSLSYVLSMASCYALIGGVASIAGSNLQIMLQSPLALGAMSMLFALLALSMFGLYEIKLPHAIHKCIYTLSHKSHNGHYLGAAIMGALSTLILSPCVTPPLVAALSFIATTHNVFFGSSALFFLGLGIGTPLLLIGTTAAKLMPKAGSWMIFIKNIFGFLMLAIALYLLERVIPTQISMLLSAFLLVFAGISIGAFTTGSLLKEQFRQSLGMILFLYGVMMLLGVALGHNNLLNPLELNKTQISTKAASAHTAKNLNTVLQILRNNKGNSVILDFYADWCTSCQFIEKHVLQNVKTQQALKNSVLVKVDVTKNNADSDALLHYFNVIAPPTFIFYDTEGKEIKNARFVGDITVNEFIERSKYSQ